VLCNSLDFSSTTDKVDLNDTKTLTGEFSVSCWIKKSSYGTDGIFGDQDQHGYGRLSFSGNPNKLYFYTQLGKTQITSNKSFPTNEWFHLVFTRDSSDNLKLYINGEDTTDGSYTQEGDITIGRIGDNPDNSAWTSLNGKMDEFLLYERELTSEEINSLFSKESIGNSIMKFSFEEGSGNDILDTSKPIAYDDDATFPEGTKTDYLS